MKEIYLIRHAQTVMNKEMRFSGILDCEISKEGYAQLEILKNKMKEYNIQQCYSSPLKRAYITAKSFFENPIKVHDLHELDFGDIDGMKFTEIEEKYPELSKNMLSVNNDFAFPNGESRDTLRQRTQRVFREIIEKDNNDSIAIVSHSCVIRNIISKEVIGDYSIAWKINIDNCSITKLQVYNTNTILAFLNR